MAKTDSAAAIIREEDLEDLEAFRRELQERIDKAYNDGRVYMMEQYVTILAGVDAEIKRIRSRFERDTLAAHRKAVKQLKADTKAKQERA